MSLVSQAWCCWPIAQNVRHHHGDATKKIFWQLVQAVGQPAWNEGLKNLGLTRSESIAVSYVLDVEPRYWATQFFPGRQWGHLTLNIAEQINNVLKSDQELPTLDLLDVI